MNKALYKKMRSDLNFKFQYRFFFMELVIDVFLIIGTYFIISRPEMYSFLASLPIALIMLRNVSVMHEGVHGLLHPKPALNYFLGLISGTLCLLPFHLWRKIHLEHHFWAGNFHKDPALEIIKRYPQSSPLLKTLLSFSWKTRIPLTAFAQYVVFWGHSLLGTLKNPQMGLLWLNMIFPMTIWGIVISKMNGQQIGILSLGIFIYLMAFEAINFPHHVGLYLEDSEFARRPIWQQYEITRTSVYTPWIEKFAVLNFNYHAEHHIFPDLPWHELPKAHHLLQKSEIASLTTVIGYGWLKQKRDEPFVSYLRPDLYKEQKHKQSA